MTATIRPKTRLTRKESQEQTRARLIGSAVELFARDGVAATSLNAVAEHAGFSRGAVHGNFADKEALASAVAVSVAGHLAPDLQRILEGDGTAADRLRRYIERFFTFCRDHAEEAAALIAVVEHEARERRGAYDERAEASLSGLVTLFHEGQSRGQMRAFDAEAMAFSVRTVLDGAASRIARGTSGSETLMTEIVTMFDAATRTEGRR
ncbi:TetR/AcrR family transcriptional regulator [Microbacterium resistens]